MRKIDTGLKINDKKIFVGDVLKFKVTPETSKEFHNHNVGRVLNAAEYDTIYVRIEKHEWLELDMQTFIMGKNKLAENGLVHHLASGKEFKEFDHEYKEVAPSLYCESLMDTTFLRFLLDQNLEVTKVKDFDAILKDSEDFYINAARDIYFINEQEDK